jgi:hypothetical protein
MVVSLLRRTEHILGGALPISGRLIEQSAERLPKLGFERSHSPAIAKLPDLLRR